MADKEELEVKREQLKRYLGQYFRSKQKKKQLENRLKIIQMEIENPLTGISYDATPHSTTNNVSDGAAAIIIRKEEIKLRIKSQQQGIEQAILNVMNVMDYLPLDSTERMILEYRHIDCMSWKQVCKEAHMTRTPCNNYYNRGLDKLLEYKKVAKAIQDYDKLTNR